MSLLELLDISSEELVDAFLDKIYDRIEYIYSQIEETGEIRRPLQEQGQEY